MPIAQQSPDAPFTVYELRSEQPDRNAPYDDDVIVEEGGSSEPAEKQDTAELDSADVYFAPDYGAEEAERAATDEIAADEPAAGGQELEVQPWEDYTRIPGAYEAAVTEEVVNPELRGKELGPDEHQEPRTWKSTDIWCMWTRLKRQSARYPSG